MRRYRAWLLRLSGMLHRERRDRELADEIESHLELHIADNIRAGMSPEEARRQAILRFGPVESIKESYRDRRGMPVVETLVGDVLSGAHVLRRNPSLASIAVLTLALGIGANAAIFSIVDAILLRPLPYHEAERIVRVKGWSDWAFTQMTQGEHFRLSPPELEDSPTFIAIALVAPGGVNLGDEPTERLRAAAVTGGFFGVLGVQPSAGHFFTPEDVEQTRQLAVISHELWQRRFATDPDVIGRSIRVNDRPFLVTGVMPPRVEFPDATDVWIPNGGDTQIGDFVLVTRLVARLADGISLAQARNEIVTLTNGDSVEVVPFAEALIGEVRPIFLLVASGALLVLLVACSNAANLLLLRVAAREPEFAVRRALGASRLRLVRQTAIESLLLAAVAALVAVPAAILTLRSLRTFVPATLHGAVAIAMNGRAFAALAAFALLTAVLFGIAPSLSVRGLRSAEVLRRAAEATVDPVRRRLRSTLVVAEIAIALVLLVGAVTIVRTVRELSAVDLGAQGERTLTFELTLPRANYGGSDRVASFFARLEAELRAVPTIESFGTTNQLPGDPATGVLTHAISVVAGSVATQETDHRALALTATPDYFAAMGIDLVSGRAFTERDGAEAPPIVIVSESFASILGMKPGEIVGHQTYVTRGGRLPDLAEIVGVVRDIRLFGPKTDFEAAVYLPFAQKRPVEPQRIVVKTRGGPSHVLGSIQRAVARIDPGLPMHNVRTFDEVRAMHWSERRFAMTAMLAFGGLAFALAVMGLYGVVAYMVQLRTREIGIRLAIGASPRTVQRQVLASGFGHAIAGVVVGTAVALVLARLVQARVPGFGSIDLIGLIQLSAATLVIAIAATWFPALRATRVDPALILHTK